MKAKVYTIKGLEKSDFDLPKEFFVKGKMSLIQQALRVLEDRSHLGLSKVKTRSEVNKTKKKWYKQKGTGGARHGARSAHIFVGGGVVHGPTGLKRVLTLPYKMRKLALKALLYKKFEDKKGLLVVLPSKVEKTKDVSTLINGIKSEFAIKSKVLLALSDAKNLKFFRNIENLKTKLFKDISVLDLANSNMVLLDQQIFGKVSDQKAVKSSKKKGTK